MLRNQELETRINACTTPDEDLILDVFRFQYTYNEVYRKYCSLLQIQPEDVHGIQTIPFLPVGMFKTHTVQCGSDAAPLCFESSGTTGQTTSKHHVLYPALYHQSMERCFEQVYGNIAQYSFLALLPSYLERGGSSLVYMVEQFMKKSPLPSGFYMHEQEKLHHQLLQNEAQGIPTILIGVTYALLEFAEAFPFPLQHTIVMETGGMKGRRAEMTRPEVHVILKNAFGLKKIHSEYGMTEMLSQAYSIGNGVFSNGPSMMCLARNPEDPFDVLKPGTAGKGAVNMIDLYNLYSCAFLALDDITEIYPDGKFSISGRLDNADLRGCNLLYI